MAKINKTVADAVQPRKPAAETESPWVEPIPEPTPEPAPEPAAKEKIKKPKPAAGLSLVGLGDLTERVNILLYGKEGSGKTTAAAQAANRGRTLVINAEGGLKASALRKQGVNIDNIVVWPQHGAHEITQQGLNEIYNTVREDLEQDPDSWYAVVVDSVTEVVSALTDNVSTHRVKKTRQRGVNIDEIEEWNTDRNDYGVVTKQVRDFVRKMRDLPCHLLLTSLERRDVDEDTGVTTYGPALTPAIQKDILGYVDLVFYLREADEEKPYRAATRQAGKYRAKDRFGVFPRVLENPDFGTIVDIVNGDLVIQDPQPEEVPKAKTTKKPKH